MTTSNTTTAKKKSPPSSSLSSHQGGSMGTFSSREALIQPPPPRPLSPNSLQRQERIKAEARAYALASTNNNNKNSSALYSSKHAHHNKRYLPPPPPPLLRGSSKNKKRQTPGQIAATPHDPSYHPLCSQGQPKLPPPSWGAPLWTADLSSSAPTMTTMTTTDEAVEAHAPTECHEASTAAAPLPPPAPAWEDLDDYQRMVQYVLAADGSGLPLTIPTNQTVMSFHPVPPAMTADPLWLGPEAAAGQQHLAPPLAPGNEAAAVIYDLTMPPPPEQDESFWQTWLQQLDDDDEFQLDPLEEEEEDEEDEDGNDDEEEEEEPRQGHRDRLAEQGDPERMDDELPRIGESCQKLAAASNISTMSSFSRRGAAVNGRQVDDDIKARPTARDQTTFHELFTDEDHNDEDHLQQQLEQMELEQELGWLEEEDMEAAVSTLADYPMLSPPPHHPATLADRGNRPYQQCKVDHLAAGRDGHQGEYYHKSFDQHGEHGGSANARGRVGQESSGFGGKRPRQGHAHQEDDPDLATSSLFATPNPVGADSTTPSGRETGRTTSLVTEVSTAQYEQLSNLLAQHFQLLLQQTVLAVRAAHHQKMHGRGGAGLDDGSTSFVEASSDDLVEILDGAVGMLQDLDQHRKDAIRHFVQWEAAKSTTAAGTKPTKRSLLSALTEASAGTVGGTGAGNRPLTRAQFSKTLLEQSMGQKRSIFDLQGLHRLTETFSMIDQCVAGEHTGTESILDVKTESQACHLVQQYIGAPYENALVPGERDLSENFVDPKEVLGPNFKPPCSVHHAKYLRKNRNLCTSGEDNLVLRGVNLYGEKQWALISDRFLPDRSIYIISQRYSKLCYMLYKAHGVFIDDTGNFAPLPKLDGVEDIDELALAKLRPVDPPAVLNVHRWSLEEDITLLKAVPIMGSMWAELGARLIPHRDRGHLRKRYQVLERRVKSTVTRMLRDEEDRKRSESTEQQMQSPNANKSGAGSDTDPCQVSSKQERSTAPMVLETSAHNETSNESSSREVADASQRRFSQDGRAKATIGHLGMGGDLLQDRNETSRAAFESLVNETNREFSRLSRFQDGIESDSETAIASAIVAQMARSPVNSLLSPTAHGRFSNLDYDDAMNDMESSSYSKSGEPTVERRTTESGDADRASLFSGVLERTSNQLEISNAGKRSAKEGVGAETPVQRIERRNTIYSTAGTPIGLESGFRPSPGENDESHANFEHIGVSPRHLYLDPMSPPPVHLTVQRQDMLARDGHSLQIPTYQEEIESGRGLNNWSNLNKNSRLNPMSRHDPSHLEFNSTEEGHTLDGVSWRQILALRKSDSPHESSTSRTHSSISGRPSASSDQPTTPSLSKNSSSHASPDCTTTPSWLWPGDPEMATGHSALMENDDLQAISALNLLSHSPAPIDGGNGSLSNHHTKRNRDESTPKRTPKSLFSQVMQMGESRKAKRFKSEEH